MYVKIIEEIDLIGVCVCKTWIYFQKNLLLFFLPFYHKCQNIVILYKYMEKQNKIYRKEHHKLLTR